MKKALLFVMALMPMLMLAQNTSPEASPSAFVGTYSFTDADGSNGTITINNPSKTEKEYDGSISNYSGTGTCVFNGITSYFSWSKRNGKFESDYIELLFSKGDLPQFAIKGNPYKNDLVNITAVSARFFVKNGWLYYDDAAMRADNPNLRFKLTKK